MTSPKRTEPDSDHTTSRGLVQVHVTPADAYEQRTRLFTALEAAFPVQFRPTENGDPDGTVTFISGEPGVPAMTGPTLALIDETPTAGDRPFGAISFRESALLPRPFRDRTLTDASTQRITLPAVFREWGEILATGSEGPVWAARPGLQHAALSWPAELASGQTLREQLTARRFMGLLPLTHFLQQLSARICWQQPESKACFVFDDPNLHWWSYGFLDYRKLSAHAEAHDYHVTAATVPLDLWYVHRATAQFLRPEDSRISFAIHGNNHTPEELRQIDEPGRASTLAAQALRRAEAARGAGAELAPVMIPPYGVSSVAMFEGCLRAGFDALCADWPYWWLSEPNVISALSGWQPLDRLGGLPLIPRIHMIASDLDDLVFRAFLGQPLILYGHHADIRSGLDLLATRAEDVRSLGVNSWQSLGRIAQDVVSSYRRDDSLMLTLHSRRAVIAIPEGIPHAEIALAGAEPSQTEVRLETRSAEGLRDVQVGEQLPVKAGAISVAMKVESFIPPPPPFRQVRAAVRRILAESRDRTAPARVRLGDLRNLRGTSMTWLPLLAHCLLCS